MRQTLTAIVKSLLRNSIHISPQIWMNALRGLQREILLPIGQIKEVILKLSPMLKIVTVPDGASVFLDGQEAGKPHNALLITLNEGCTT